MRILITGGGGLIGQKVARALIARGGLFDELNTHLGETPQAPTKLTEVVLFDQAFPPDRIEDPRVRYVAGDMLDRDLLARTGEPQLDAVFHFASVVSAGAE